jgi:hypothetical protein
MKIYLDDVRETPAGFVRTYTVEETIDLLKNNFIEELSLDHDLGTEKTGYDVLLWIEREVVLNGYIPPGIMKVHSANPVGREKMTSAIQSIERLKEKKQ